jgi:hypothetical protein
MYRLFDVGSHSRFSHSVFRCWVVTRFSLSRFNPSQSFDVGSFAVQSFEVQSVHQWNWMTEPTGPSLPACCTPPSALKGE